MSVFSSLSSGTSPAWFCGTLSVGFAVGFITAYYLGGKKQVASGTFGKSHLNVANPIQQYLIDHSLREPAILQKLKQATMSEPDCNEMMLCAAEESQFFRILLQTMNAKKTIEIGTFTGYNTLSMAMALPDDGKIIACDVSEEYSKIAREFWKEAGVEQKIDLRIQPALDTLDSLIEDGEGGTFDFIFIDADKENYLNYYERAITLVRRGGIVAIDNVLWFGRVVDSNNMTPDTVSIREVNERVYKDDRVEISMLLLGDGVTLAMMS